MSATRFSVRLVQHTPIIHFQHDQPDATLRATELKPKLDRYLAEPTGREGPFRYQLRIRPLGEQTQNDEGFGSRYLYFGNVGSGRKKHAVQYAEGAELSFNTYFDQSLADAIREALPRCLALENFGCRQNKGYGCFYIDPEEEGFPDPKTALGQSGRPVYVFGVQKNPAGGNRNQGDTRFQAIEALYKAMKSGINETSFRNDPNAYLKSLLWRYVNENRTPSDRTTWEKRYLKLLIKGSKLPAGQYLRAVLGVAEQFLFLGGNVRMDEDYGDTGNVHYHGSTQFSVKGKRIGRFKSPITFKPVGLQVFIVLDPGAYEQDGRTLWDAPFEFDGPPGNVTLRAPESFDLVGFMDFVAGIVKSNDFGSLRQSQVPTAQTLRGLSIARIA
jgi:hypothetical protein